MASNNPELPNYAFRAFDANIVQETHDQFERNGAMIDFIQYVLARHSTPLSDGESVMRTLGLVAACVEEDRPLLGEDPARPDQTAYMIGACLGLDSTSRLIRMHDMHESEIYLSWLNSTNFLMKDDRHAQTPAETKSLLKTAVVSSSQRRLSQLGTVYNELLNEYGGRCLDEGLIAPEHLQSLHYGCAFVFGGVSTTLELVRMDQSPDVALTDDEIDAWLAS